MTKIPKNVSLLNIGIAGASSCGKTTLFKQISGYLGQENVTHFDLDGYHLHGREDRKRLNEYPDELKANDINKIVHDLTCLISGKNIDMPIYDHKKGIFSSPLNIAPKPILFIEGLHAIMINKIVNFKLIDLSVFIYPSEDLRKSWKIKRDVNERGYSYSEATEQITNRDIFVTKYIFPQINIADILVLIKKEDNYKSIRHRVLLSTTLYNKCHTNKSIKDSFLKCFHIQEVKLNHKYYLELHLRKNDIIIDVLKKEISRLGLIIPINNISFKRHRYSFTEVTEILLALIVILAGRR